MIKLYKVGGYVRDKYLGKDNKDIDYAVEAPSYEAMRDYFLSKGTIYQERPQYLTIRGKINGDDSDFVLCRKEGFYTDGRRPDSVTIGTIEDDLARRDFTCNAMAEDEEGNLLDPFGGRNDLDHKLLRCVGTAWHRFNEDSLRLVRAIRFSVTKNLKMDHEIQACLYDDDTVAKLANVSVERIREELYKCFMFHTIETLNTLHSYPRLHGYLFSKIQLVPTIDYKL